MSKCRIAFVVVLSFLYLFPSSGFADSITNGEFTSGLTAWTSAGGVVAPSGLAALPDSEGYAVLYQGAALTPGNYLLEFDFAALLSPEVPQGSFADSWEILEFE